MRQSPATEILTADFSRPDEGLRYSGSLPSGFERSLQVAWQSNGGPNRGHPARSLPFTLDIPLEPAGELRRIHLLGIFALFASRAEEAPGTFGASIQLVSDQQQIFRVDLLNARHYANATEQRDGDRVNGDGTSLSTVGSMQVAGATARVDLLTIDLPEQASAQVLRFKDLGSPASFVLFDVFLESVPAQGCPFHSRGGGVPLAEIPALVRVGDRVRFSKAIDQLETSILCAEDLDEARGQALTFLAMITSALLEMGGSRSMHRLQLEAAREFDDISTPEDLAAAVRRRIEDATSSIFKEPSSPSAHLVDRALAIVERNYARILTDSVVAKQLGLSTSHFRFLFKDATGQPFHKYLVALRLEKARRLLIEGDLAVSDVARAVGFAGLSHFSRAFTQRFSVSPTQIRRSL